jgi:hypothetical protein
VIRKQRWADQSPTRKAAVLAGVALQALLVAAAQKDLSSREERQVRGPKILWRVLTMNTVGGIAYFAVGRL